MLSASALEWCSAIPEMTQYGQWPETFYILFVYREYTIVACILNVVWFNKNDFKLKMNETNHPKILSKWLKVLKYCQIESAATQKIGR